MRDRRKRNPQVRRLAEGAALFIGVLLLCLVLVEITLRMTYPLYANFNTEMWRYSRDIKTISDIPGVSHVHLPNRTATLYGVEVHTNSLGFRDKEYTVDKPPHTRRVLVLGDSVTLGWGVPENETYASKLEERLNQDTYEPVEVLNTAVGNYNSEMEAIMLKQYAYLDPDAIVVGFFPNDGEKTVLVQQGPTYALKKNLYLYPLLWDRVVVRLGTLLRNHGGTITSRIHEYYTPEYGGLERINASFSSIANTADALHAKVYVVIIPHFFQEFTAYDAGYIHTYVKQLCIEYGFVCVDTLPAFADEELGDIIISPEDAHPNARGHQIIADQLYAFMRTDFNEKQ